MHATEPLRAAADDLAAEIRRHRPPDCAGTSGAVQAWYRTSGRFAEGRVSDISVQRGEGTSARYVLRDGFRHRSVPGLDPRAAVLDGTGRRSPAAGPPGGGGPGPDWMDLSRVLPVLGELEKSARDFDPAVAQVVIDFELSEQDMVLAQDDLLHEEHRLLSYLTVRVIARRGGRTATGFYTPGVSGSLDGIDAGAAGAEVAQRAVTGLDARPAPVGHLPVVVAGGRGMVLLHEACCHPLEGDEVLRGSVYAARIGESVASPLVTITDDPTVPGAVGSFRYDDEGTPGAPTTLIENGVLRSYLTDQESAARLGLAPSGNGRCTTVLHPPQPRMTNTCLAAGTSAVQDIVSGTEFGIFAQHVGGGEVIESTGEFTFRVTNGFLIENGRITDPIEETTITGTGTQVLRDIDAIADDPVVGAAKCGKFGQWVPVGVVGPTLRVRSLLVGGTRR
ncbi:TldD/PmbA family protein [Streptomyces sp. NPDC056468]|uniref:TldD/PmbA family protein n=1 Tax=unclassified Streptomyces TaxID=2593676 RepID=UPI0036BD0EF8